MFDPADHDSWDPWVLAFNIERDGIVSNDDFRLVDQGRETQHAGNLVLAGQLYHRAVDWATHARTPDARRTQAEALVYLGDLTRQYDPQASQQYYEQARFLFEALSPHNLGVVAHRLATLHEQNTRYTDAWTEYTAMLTLWRELARENGRLGNRNRYAKYRRDIQQIEEQINGVLGRAGGVGAAPAVEPPAEPPAPLPPAAAERARAWDLGPDAEVDVIPVYGNLAGGSGVWLADDYSIETYARMDRVLIEGTRYRIINLLPNNALVHLASGFLHGLARVEGKSMDRAGIDDRDYVLFRKPRDVPYVPQDHEVVAATVVRNEIREGVVKRYRMEDGRGWLQPESTEPHDPIDLDTVGVEWIGQVIAVLKPEA